MNMKNYSRGWRFRLRSEAIGIILVFIASVLISKCSPALYMPAAPDAERTGIALDTLIKGRTLYINNCGSCHYLRMPESYTAVQWEKNVNEMQKKAKVSKEQKETILKY